MKKKFLIMVSCLLVICVTINIPCYAESNTDDTSCYVTGEKADEIYEMLQSDSFSVKKVLDYYSLTILKESITYVYTLDTLEYAETGKLNILPMYADAEEKIIKGAENGNVYTVKMITSDGQFAGNIIFYVKDRVAYSLLTTPTDYSTDVDQIYPTWYDASFSYADHAARIAEDMKKQDLVSANDVKFVSIDYMGDFFYVNDGEEERFYAVGRIPSTYLKDPVKEVEDYSLDKDQLLDKAKECLDEYNEYLKERAEWEAQHPGEVWNKIGSGNATPVISSCSHVEDILDIASYLNIDYGTATKQELNIKSPNNTIGKTELILIGIAVVLVLSAAAVSVSIKKEQQKSNAVILQG